MATKVPFQLAVSSPVASSHLSSAARAYVHTDM